MVSRSSPSPEELCAALRDVSQTADDLLGCAKSSVRDSPEEFVNVKIGRLFGLSHAYKRCFVSLQITSRSQLENFLRDNFKHSKVRDAYDELENFEKEWDSFLDGIDKQLKKEFTKVIGVNDEGPVDIPLIDADIAAANGQVVVLTFGVKEGALQWLNDTECNFPMLQDQERKIYHAFGLQKSVQKVWGILSMVYYAEQQVAQGRKLPKSYEHVEDDPKQMGGDFILDAHGKVAFKHCSQESFDRPPVEVLIKVLQWLLISRVTFRKRIMK